jgi:CRISPR/Cas system endoribonuclease Cas6 (RAMP superfamily)
MKIEEINPVKRYKMSFYNDYDEKEFLTVSGQRIIDEYNRVVEFRGGSTTNYVYSDMAEALHTITGSYACDIKERPQIRLA